MSDTPLKPDEAASLLGVSKWTVLKLIHRDEIQAYDVSLNPSSGRPQWRIDPAEIEAFKKRRQNGIAKPIPVSPAPIESRQVIPRKATRHYV